MIIGFLVVIGITGTAFMLQQRKAINDLKAKLDTFQSRLATNDELINRLLVRTDPKELTYEQREFKDSLEAKWKKLVDQVHASYGSQLSKQKTEFEEKIAAEYKKAVDAIDFHTVEYKKSITKKRKETSRKTKATKPQKDYRSIDDE